MAEGRHFKFGG